MTAATGGPRHRHPRPVGRLPPRRPGHPRAARHRPAGRARGAGRDRRRVRIRQEHRRADAARPAAAHRPRRGRVGQGRRAGARRRQRAHRPRASAVAWSGSFRRTRPSRSTRRSASVIRSPKPCACAVCRSRRSTPRWSRCSTQAGIDDPVARARQYPHELSGGLRQRVLIAIALAGDPDVIVADEPTSALDVTVQRRILDHLDSLVRERGIALVIITHDLGVAADRADRVVVLRNGLVVEQGSAIDVLAAPVDRLHAAPRRRRARPGDGRTAPRTRCAEPLCSCAGRRSSRTSRCRRARHPRALRAVDGVSLEARAGRTLAIVGESGSGKTTLLRIALGVGDAHPWPRRLRRRRHLRARLARGPAAASPVPARAAEPVRRRSIRGSRSGAASPSRSSSFGIGTRASRRARVAELLDLVGCRRMPPPGARRSSPAGSASVSAIARALAIEPELLYLDEPVSALDVSVQDQVLRLLARLQNDLGVGYVLVSHDLGVVAQVAHDVAVVRHGRVARARTRSLGAGRIHPRVHPGAAGRRPRPSPPRGPLMSRYIVIGAGALGALLAAQWTIAQIPVTLVARGASLRRRSPAHGVRVRRPEA